MVRKHAKRLLEQALMELLEQSTLDKIDVRELAKKAGLSRQTFYYNFKNKQDMINWIFNKNNDKAKAALQEKINLYGQTLLNAVKEVEDALIQEEQQIKYLDSIKKQLNIKSVFIWQKFPAVLSCRKLTNFQLCPNCRNRESLQT